MKKNKSYKQFNNFQKKIILITVFSFTALSEASVNLKDASFQITHTDSNVKIRDVIDRSYSSRSLYNGLFGFGWCSSLEHRLSLVQKYQLQLSTCTRKYSFVSEVGEVLGVSYVNQHHNSDKIYKINQKYIRFVNGQRREVYNEYGVLQRIYLNSRQFIKLIYQDRRLKGLRMPEGNELNVFYGDLGKVSTIRGEGTHLQYFYKGEDLVSVKNHGGVRFRYRYDRLHNMTFIQSLSAQNQEVETRKLAYNQSKDWITEVVSSNGCRQSIRYSVRSNSSDDHYVSRSEINCQKKSSRHTFFEFWYKKGHAQNKYLHKLVKRQRGVATETVFDPVSGLPQRVLKLFKKSQRWSSHSSPEEQNQREPSLKTKAQWFPDWLKF